MPDDHPDPAALRRRYRLDPGLVFLNHGSYGACADAVIDAQRRWQDELERNPVEFLGRRSAALLREARLALAPPLGADADDLAWVPNASQGVAIALATLERAGVIAPGAQVIAGDHEYGACLAMLAEACRRTGAELHTVALPADVDDAGAVERLAEAFGPRTRLLFVSQATSVTARVLPVAALVAAARAQGIVSLVDAAHAPGQLPMALDATSAEFTTGNLHKWVGAPKGAAFLHVRRDWHDRVVPPLVGWGALAEAGEAGHDGYTGASVLERRLLWLGTRDPTPWLAVPAALAFHAEHLAPAQARCRAMAHGAFEALATMAGDGAASGGLPRGWRRETRLQMAAFPLETPDAGRLQRWLFDEHRIEVPLTRLAPADHWAPPRRFVRVSVQAYNGQNDIAAFTAAMQQALSRGLWRPAAG